jgi:hypothetical protein
VVIQDHGCDEAVELCEVMHAGSAPHDKHVVAKVINVVPHVVIEIEEYLYMPTLVFSCYLNT